MAKGTYRKKRLQVLEELTEVDPAWADQLRAMRATEPQAYRKGLIKADVMLAARLGRATILSMRPKRFGGDEDPLLARRVQELRQHYRKIESAIALPPSGWARAQAESDAADDPEPAPSEGPETFSQQARRRIAEGRGPSRQGAAAPSAPEGDRSPAKGGRPARRSPVGERAQNPLTARAGTAAPSRPSTPSSQDLDAVLKGSVSDVKGALDKGDLDGALDVLERRERAGKGRKGVLRAIESRRDAT